MGGEDDNAQRVQFFGLHDLSTGFYVQRVAELVEQFDNAGAPSETMDIIELHHVEQFVAHGLLPSAYTESERTRAISQISKMHSAVARYFSAVDDTNCVSIVRDVSFIYHADLLELLGRSRAFERCRAAVMLQAIGLAGVHLGEMLACKKLVAAYDSEIRSELLASPNNAEHLIRKYLQQGVSGEVHLPGSLTRADSRDLIERYIGSPGANPNYIGLIESAPVRADWGIDAKLKLSAKRRNAEMTEKFFESNSGFKVGTEVRLSAAQDEPIKFEIDESGGLVTRFTYSSSWLDETADNASILNNFQHLFEFVNEQAILTFPAYTARLGIFERFMGTAGKTHYPVGAEFRAVDASSILQTRLYQHWLQTRDRSLEGVISWFFAKYLADEFGASNFEFRPSSSGASYSEKVRHVFVEMESVLAQFGLYVENGELDRELLAITSDPILYRSVPSLLAGKYAYPTEDDTIEGILYVLFSDQSPLTYIDEDRKGGNAAELLIQNEIAYGDFHDHQKQALDHVIALGVLKDTGERVQVSNIEQFLALRSLYATEASSYYHLSDEGRAELDDMVTRGWVRRSSTLLTEAEAKYFNYFLNKVDFSNGPEMRNKYLHGSQADGDGEGAHFGAYVIALRLMIALVIKLNDDFCLSANLQVKV